MIYLVITTVGLALLFDFLNGFHDAANSIATIVTTRALTPGQAVVWAAFFNFVAVFLFGTGVAKTISSGLINPAAIDVAVILGGVIGGIGWNLLTWYLALPTSSSHAIISAFAGAAISKAGRHALLLRGWVPVLLFLVLSRCWEWYWDTYSCTWSRGLHGVFTVSAHENLPPSATCFCRRLQPRAWEQ